ncbi:LytTR family DNA-binding domain-containing protein [Dyadobacter sp. CY343]|uniref:LytR/AlgR family response regulator transcription factor n=1 Tax=Dyadobacter sp. CY343 TaxID=2907299 RepID=UPI001F3839A7|nr:LytTR family DNA-binding domain-containing protein [Dyadobacter sp. CY343]MCE7060331.1 LytTR family transcriptional regulator DNA-binding domain-containing protein [Dyadobacter sp. CY343]
MRTSVSHDYFADQRQSNEIQGSNAIVVYHLGRALSVAGRDVAYLEGVGNYTFVCTKSNRYLVAKCLKTVQEVLGGDFVRVHKSYSVNRYHIKQRWFDNIQLHCGKNIPIARRRLSSAHEALSAAAISPSGF